KDYVKDPDAVSPVEGLDHARLERETQDGIALLSSREQNILRWRCGMSGEKEHTLEEIGAKLGLSRERVRQLEARALAKLRASDHGDRLRAFVLAPPPPAPPAGRRLRGRRPPPQPPFLREARARLAHPLAAQLVRARFEQLLPLRADLLGELLAARAAPLDQLDQHELVLHVEHAIEARLVEGRRGRPGGHLRGPRHPPAAARAPARGAGPSRGT